MTYAGMRAIVTGAASGIGLHVTNELLALGASVAAIDINGEGLCILESSGASAGERLRCYRADLRSEADVVATVNAVVRDGATIDVLINSAGIYRDGVLVAVTGRQTRKLPLTQWNQVIDTDLTGPFLLTREVAAHMVGRGSGGVIINVSSTMQRGNAGQSNYSAAKAGVAALTKVWAEELAPYAIRVATIAPGFVRTPMLAGTDPEVLRRWIERVPLRRLGEPAEIFLAVKFILECDFFTGKCVEVDGGLSI